MNKKDIFELFYTDSAKLDTGNILTLLLSGLLIGAVIYLVYFMTYRGVAYNSRFNASLVLLLLISEVIMIMIGSNIVISLGMVGALSIVRFRTAIKDSRDTVFIFWAIVEGLCVGSQNFKLALLAVLIIGLSIVAFAFIPRKQNKYLLIVHGEDTPIDIDRLKGILEKSSLQSVNNDENHQEFIFEIQMKKEPDNEFIEKVRSISGVTAINWVKEIGEYVG